MLVVQVIFCAVLLLAGVALLVLGWRGLRAKLPRNRHLGVRTPASMRSAEAFELANRAAAPGILAGGAVAMLAGIALPALASGLSVALVIVLGLLGAFALMTIGGLTGNRAAEAVPAPTPVTGGCGGCAGGCCSALSQG